MAKVSVYRKKIPELSEQQIRHFWSLVDVRGENECWPYLGATQRYGVFGIGSGNNFKAHRVAFFITYGIQPDYNALHSCDNPPCCNPKHLRSGTTQDNADDMVERGRSLVGERNPLRKHPEKIVSGKDHYRWGHAEYSLGEKNGRAKITEKDAIEIRERFTAKPTGLTVKAFFEHIGTAFGISASQVKKIVYSNTWPHLGSSLGRRSSDS